MRQWGTDDGRRRHGQWLADGQTFIAGCDASGEDRLEVFRDGIARTLPWDTGRIVAMAAAPRGSLVAIANHRNEVLVGDVDGGELHVADRSDHGRSESLAWSPDGAWLAYPSWTSARHIAIKLHEVATRTSTLATQPDFRDYSPAFDPAGKYLYFLSVRTFDPVYDSVQFELSFPRAARPYLVALQADAAPPFEPPPRAFGPPEAGAAAPGERREDDPKPPAATRVDLAGIAARVAPFPVPESRYGQIAGVVGEQGAVDAPDGGRGARPGRPQGGSRSARALRLRHAAGRDDAGARRSVRGERRRNRAGRARRQEAARRRGRPQAGGRRRRDAVAQVRLDRPRPDPRLGHAAQRVAADAARGVAAAARPLLDGGHVGRRLERDPRSLRAAARPRGHARRALRPHLGDAGRARHLARLRDGRRLPQATGNPAGTPGRRARAGRRRARLRDCAHRHRRRLGSRRRLAAQCHRRAGARRRAHRGGQRPAGFAHGATAGLARPPGGEPRSS